MSQDKSTIRFPFQTLMQAASQDWTQHCQPSMNYKVSLHLYYNVFFELLQFYTASRNLRSSNRNLLVKPYFNLNSYGKRAFSVAAPKLWKNLPEDIKSANSIDDFKRKLKTFLFMRAYES